MREIKFRAKVVKDIQVSSGGFIPAGEWITWYPLAWVPGWTESIDKESVSQFTGLKDKNGVEIFEGDIVRATKNWPGKGSQAFISTFRDNTATFAFHEAFTNGDGEKYFYDALQVSGIEVTGNIHENPELLEVTS